MNARPTVTVDSVIEHLMQLRATLTHAPTPQMNPNYNRLTRHQRRLRQRASKFPSYEDRVQRKIAAKRGEE